MELKTLDLLPILGSSFSPSHSPVIIHPLDIYFVSVTCQAHCTYVFVLIYVYVFWVLCVQLL